jgi:UPF0271 protein
MKVLLNGDLCGSDEDAGAASALLAVVDLVNVAGDETALRRVAAEALSRGVPIGALLVLRDVEAKDVSPRGLTELMAGQIAAVERVLAESGTRLGHVKLRGALRLLCDERSDLAEACVDWMELEREGVPLIVGAGGLLHAVAEARGVPLLREILAGRVYADEARLVPHGQPGAVIDDPAEAIRCIEEWRNTGYLTLADGRRWLVEAETVGVSADSPQSAEIARAVREVLGRG